MAVYLTADWHFCHDRPFIWKARGCADIEEMNRRIVERAHERMTDEDDLYVLGDLMLRDNTEGMRLVEAMPGKLHIIRGNHDTDQRIELYRKSEKIVEVCDAKWLRTPHHAFFLSHYPCLTANYDDGSRMSQHVVSLAGHVHTTDPFSDWDKGMIYHVEVDAHDLYPVELDAIIAQCRRKLYGTRET